MFRSRTLRSAACVTLVTLLAASLPGDARAFCGFYVAKADTKLFNKASQVAIVRNGDRTVLTMANDYQGSLDEFAMVIPVPTFITREQIHVGNRAVLEHLDAYSAPRLVEYFDPNPCAVALMEDMAQESRAPAAKMRSRDAGRREGLGVTVEATYTVGEYDILILSATQSRGLETWLLQNDYRLPEGASSVLGSYLKQGMKFFVARVNIKEQRKLGYSFLRPLQIAFESPKFMLPIRLGMLNAQGKQELYVYLLTRKGRVETTNYRTVKIPSDMDVPVFVKNEFSDFYRDMFAHQLDRENGRAVFMEYAWNMAWCDPCAASPLSADELRELGVFWLDPGARRNAAQEVFLTRLHVRYDDQHFPQDLVFQETGDARNFQGRYVLRHAWTGDLTCSGAEAYRADLSRRWSEEARTLASLTGWELDTIHARMDGLGMRIAADPPRPWWRRLWGGQSSR